MASRKSPAIETPTFDKLTSKLDAFIDVMEAHADQTDESIGEMTQIVKDLAEEVKILRVAIDDIRCEIEWSLRHVVPPRTPAIGLPVKSLPKVQAVPRNGNVVPPAVRPTDEANAEPGRLF